MTMLSLQAKGTFIAVSKLQSFPDASPAYSVLWKACNVHAAPFDIFGTTLSIGGMALLASIGYGSRRAQAWFRHSWKTS